jgi:hypothetical protein
MLDRNSYRIDNALALGGLAFAQTDQIDNPNPPPEPRPRLASATDVSTSGAMTTRLSVALSAARGPVPSIGLTYNSGGANGIAGVGWHLSGFPAIVRARYGDDVRRLGRVRLSARRLGHA